MGRTFLADDRIQAYLNSLLGTGDWYLGLIIGQLTTQKDHVVHLVRTPEPMEDQASDDDELDDADKPRRARRKSQCKPQSLGAINEQWAATHAKQATAMLPGGLNVIGIFALAPPAMMPAAQTKLRQILFAIRKLERKCLADVQVELPTDRALLQVCTATHRLTCRTIDVADPKSSFRPADWKYTSTPERWNRLQTDVALDIPLDVHTESQDLPILKQIQACIQPFCTRLKTSLTLIDGTLRNPTELLDQSTDSRKVKGRDRAQTTQLHTYRCNVLLKLNDKNSGSTMAAPTIQDTGSRVQIRGTVHSCAYVTAKTSVADAELAVKADIARSLSSRCQLLCNDIQMVEEDADTQDLYNTPMRVFFQLPGTTIDLCDYMFKDEKVSEVTARIRELLDITVDEDDLDTTCERVATEEDCSMLGKNISPEGSVTDETPVTHTRLKYYLGLSGALAFLAAGLTFFLVEET